jgi:hypothetical protein
LYKAFDAFCEAASVPDLQVIKVLLRIFWAQWKVLRFWWKRRRRIRLDDGRDCLAQGLHPERLPRKTVTFARAKQLPTAELLLAFKDTHLNFTIQLWG